MGKWEFVKQAGSRSAPQATGENGKVATNEGGNKVTATKTVLFKRDKRPELTQEKFLGEGATRVMADPAKVDAQQRQ